MTLAEISKQSTEAFTHAMTFESMQIAPDLVSFLNSHTMKAKNLYSKFQNLIVQEVNKEKDYEEVLLEAARLFSNWDAKEAYITACTNAAKTSLKGVTKKKKQLPFTE